MNNCLDCNKETQNPKFCSQSCAARFNNKKFPKRHSRGPSLCQKCLASVPSKNSYSRIYCDECLQGRDLPLSEAIYTKHHKSLAFQLVRSRAKKVVSNREKSCEECGYIKHVEVCHVIPISHFSLETMVSTINDEKNLRILCPNCHWEMDHPS